MKSLYATLSKATLKSPQRPKTPTFAANSRDASAPKRPPRKPRSQSSMSDHQQQYRSMSSLNMSKQSRTTLDGRTWDVHSTTSSTLPRRSSVATKPTPTPRTNPNLRPTSRMSSKTRLSISSAEPSMVHGFRGENRDPPKFERQRDDRSRFFGQDISDDSEVVERSRPPPDMRRYLLDNVNKSRAPKHQPSVIRAM